MGGAGEEAPEERWVSAGLRGAGIQGKIPKISHSGQNHRVESQVRGHVMGDSGSALPLIET